MSTYLMHHGIKGMKWGVRRYQNEDGTLTEAGKARYRVFEGDDRKFEKTYSRNMVNYYNQASRTFNREVLPEINREFGDRGIEDKEYVKAVSEAWKDTYADVLLSNLGLHREMGADYVENAFEYGMYDAYYNDLFPDG